MNMSTKHVSEIGTKFWQRF